MASPTLTWLELYIGDQEVFIQYSRPLLERGSAARKSNALPQFHCIRANAEHLQNRSSLAAGNAISCSRFVGGSDTTVGYSGGASVTGTANTESNVAAGNG